METSSREIAALAVRYGWKDAALYMDERISGQIQRNIEKSAVISVSKYMKSVEKIIDRFFRMVDQTDEDEPIITSIADLEKLIKLQLLLSGLGENGLPAGPKDDGPTDAFLKKESARIEDVRKRIEESSRITVKITDVVGDDDQDIEAYLEDDDDDLS